MKKLLLIALILRGLFCEAQTVKFVKNEAESKVDVLIGGQFFTSYIYPDEKILKKPVLFPIKTAKGATITRGYPLAPRPFERTDHPHHVGLWLNYEYVNGLDYWNNSTAIPADKRLEKYGLIRHTGFSKIKNGKVGKLDVTADWIEKDGTGNTILRETTQYRFSGKGDVRIIDRITTLTAAVEEVALNDVKDGMLALRVTRELEHPSNKPEIFTDANGIETKVPVVNTEGIVGKYHSSEGVDGEAVWSTRAKWMNLSGKVGNEEVAVAMIDHPKNVNYPTYWHARGYGLFALNPLGEKVFTNGKKTLNLKLKKGESVTFKYRVVVKSGVLTDAELNALATDFSK
ncbi:MAG: PmoA family protein [Saprospiraceae bacterium]|nr:PmoA family protein [Saprospiraceae bacterium]